ncbi:hypothetical protein Tco_1138935, partial [Tanacetum coccineum]
GKYQLDLDHRGFLPAGEPPVQGGGDQPSTLENSKKKLPSQERYSSK